MPFSRRSSFTAILERSNNRLWGCHFRVPRSIADKVVEKKSRRVICELNGVAEHQCALLPDGTGSYLVTVNKQLQSKLKVSFGSKVHVRLRKDDSKYGLPVPEEFRELLRQDKQADGLFHALTPGKQRTLLYIVAKAKDSDARLIRGNAIVRHLKSNGGKIDYRRLAKELQAAVRLRTAT